MGKNKYKIGVDIDGVLIDMDVMAYFRFLEKEFGWNINYDLFAKTHSWYGATGQTSPHVLSRALKVFFSKVEESQKPIEGAHDALKKIGEVADIFLITARSRELKLVTEEFIGMHLQDVRYSEISMDNFRGKTAKIIDLGLDYYIDDSFNEISILVENEDIDTRLIPFPGFHGLPDWSNIKDERVHWLSVWEDIKHDLDATLHGDIRRKAWEEITSVIV